jgi:hypothetical protein
MLSLNDVLPRHERVNVGEGEIDVFGISGEDIGEILRRYPNAINQMWGSQPINMEPGLLGALIAASQRTPEGASSYLGDEGMEKKARAISAYDQARIMKAIGRCTFPEGVGPFVEDLESMSASLTEAVELVVQVVSRARGTASPQTQKPSEPPQTPPSGDSPPDK